MYTLPEHVLEMVSVWFVWVCGIVGLVLGVFLFRWDMMLLLGYRLGFEGWLQIYW